MLAIAATLAALILLRNRPRAMCGVALAACVLPLLLPTSDPLLRAGTALLTWLFLVKTLQFAARHEAPTGVFDLLLFLTIPAVVRWQAARRPDYARALRSVVRGLGQLALMGLLTLTVISLDARNPVQLITTQVGIYLALAGVLNIAAATLSARGLDYDDPFDNPLAARTPAEFWSRRWNTWVSHMLHRYVFLPAGGRRHPLRGTLAAFAASAALHEGFVVVGLLTVSGWMGAYFLLQGVLVAVTSRWRPFRRLAREVPALGWLVTLAVLLASGTLLVRGADGLDPSQGWRRCCSG